MEQVTLQAIKLKQLSRSQNGVTGENSSSDGFMQIIDNMLSNLVDGETVEVTDVLSGKSAEDTENGVDSSLLAMLSELLQSGGTGNLSQDILELFQNIDGIEGIDSIEIPNMISKLQENNFFEAMGMDEDTADTLYTLGNNTYNYLDAQTDVIQEYISSKLESGDAGATKAATQTVMETGVLQNRETTGVNKTDSQKVSYNANEMPITSVSYEKT